MALSFVVEMGCDGRGGGGGNGGGINGSGYNGDINGGDGDGSGGGGGGGDGEAQSSQEGGDGPAAVRAIARQFGVEESRLTVTYGVAMDAPYVHRYELCVCAGRGIKEDSFEPL